jgi:hypothetical protein
MLIALYLHSGKLWSLILSSIFASLAVGTRFVGLVVLITGVLAILLLSRNTFKNKVLNSILYSMIGFLPLVTWLAWVIVNYGNEVRRSYSFNMNLWERFGPIRLAFIEAIYSWVPVLEWIKLPGGYNQKKFIVPVVIIILVGIFAVVVWKSIKNGQDQGKSMTGVRFMGVFAIFTVTYVVFYTLAYMFNNPQPDLIERLLFPIYLGAVYTMFILLWTGAQAWDSRRAIPALALAFALLFCVTDFKPNLSLSRQLNATGEGYTGVRWRNSGILSVAQEIPEDVPLISNEFSAIHLLLNRKTYGLSELITQKPSLSFTRFGDNPSDSAERAFREDGAALILFDVVRWQFDALYPNQAEDRMKALVDGLYLYNDTYDGTIYFYEKPDWLVEP